MLFTQTSFPLDKMMAVLQSNQVKRTPQEAIKNTESGIRKRKRNQGNGNGNGIRNL